MYIVVITLAQPINVVEVGGWEVDDEQFFLGREGVEEGLELLQSWVGRRRNSGWSLQVRVSRNSFYMNGVISGYLHTIRWHRIYLG